MLFLYFENSNCDWLKCVYYRNSDCTWRIERLGDSKSMELSFKFIDIEWEKDGPCSYDNVKIKDGKLISSIEGGGAVIVFSATFNNIQLYRSGQFYWWRRQ